MLKARMKKERINENSGGSAYEAVAVVEVEDTTETVLLRLVED